jgi:LDH2 family malate/lactate/ureidoglycolate dehydrogenase
MAFLTGLGRPIKGKKECAKNIAKCMITDGPVDGTGGVALPGEDERGEKWSQTHGVPLSKKMSQGE